MKQKRSTGVYGTLLLVGAVGGCVPKKPVPSPVPLPTPTPAGVPCVVQYAAVEWVLEVETVDLCWQEESVDEWLCYRPTEWSLWAEVHYLHER